MYIEKQKVYFYKKMHPDTKHAIVKVIIRELTKTVEDNEWQAGKSLHFKFSSMLNNVMELIRFKITKVWF
jgi:hypothetical protein